MYYYISAFTLKVVCLFGHRYLSCHRFDVFLRVLSFVLIQRHRTYNLYTTSTVSPTPRVQLYLVLLLTSSICSTAVIIKRAPRTPSSTDILLRSVFSIFMVSFTFGLQHSSAIRHLEMSRSFLVGLCQLTRFRLKRMKVYI